MIRIVIACLIAGSLVACAGNEDKKAANQPELNQPLASKNTELFNQSFENLLYAYEDLKEALVDYNIDAADTAAVLLGTKADSLSLGEIQGDSTGSILATASSYTASIKNAAKELVAVKDLQKKKRQFQVISDQLYDLVRTVKYDKKTIYHQSCPMAFNDEEQAYWISMSSEVINPYLGKQHPKYKDGMLHCGEVADSLTFN